MALARWQPTSTKRRLLTTLIAVFALLAQPMYSLVASQVAYAAPDSAVEIIDLADGDSIRGTSYYFKAQGINFPDSTDSTEEMEVRSFMVFAGSVATGVAEFSSSATGDSSDVWTANQAFDTTTVPDGTYTVRAKSCLASSALCDIYEDNSDVTFTVDNASPTISNLSVSDDDSLSGTVVLSVDVEDNSGTVDNVTFIVSPMGGAAGPTLSATRLSGTDTWTYSLDTANGSYPDGLYRIATNARDEAGNLGIGGVGSGYAENVMINNTPAPVDTDAPVITDITPADNTELPRSTNYQISAKVEDPSGVASVSYRIQAMATNPVGPGMVYDQLPFGVMTDTDGDDVYTATIDTTSLPIVVNYDSDGDSTDDATVPVEYYRILVDATDSSPAANTTFGGDGEIVSFLTLAADDTPGDDNTGDDEEGGSTGGDNAGGSTADEDDEAAPGVPNTATANGAVASLLSLVGISAALVIAGAVAIRRYAHS